MAGLLLCAFLTGAGGATAHSGHTADHVAAMTTVMAAAPVRAAADGPGEGLGIRLLEAPVSRRKDPRALAGVVDHVDPGTVIKRRIEVSNTTERKLHVFLYAAAADIKDQTFVFAPGRTQNELSSWISVEPAEVDVPAGEVRTALFTIRVPRTAWRGERFAEIWAQTEVPPDKKHNVGLATRVGIRVFLDVGPGGERPSNMRIEKLTPERDAAGHPRLLAQVPQHRRPRAGHLRAALVDRRARRHTGGAVPRHGGRAAQAGRDRTSDHSDGQRPPQRSMEGRSDPAQRNDRTNRLRHHHFSRLRDG